MPQPADGRPVMRTRDLVVIGSPLLGRSPLKGVVVQSFENGDAEVVYLDYRDRAINENISWSGNQWDLKDSLGGGYADRYGRLREFVDILRSK